MNYNILYYKYAQTWENIQIGVISFSQNSIEATECDKNTMVVQMTTDNAKVAQSANLGLYFECLDNIQ
jgi:hypothetical protein